MGVLEDRTLAGKNMQEQALVERDLEFAPEPTRRGRRILDHGWRWLSSPWRLARTHGLNPWVFVAMSALGYAINAMVYLPWFHGQAWQLTFLVLLRVVALVVPAYILLKGRRIAAAFNVSVAAMFIVNTTWHVCYYVYL